MSKYRSRKCSIIIGGKKINFDSVTEKDRFLYLREKEKKGMIFNLQLQKRFLLQERFNRKRYLRIHDSLTRTESVRHFQAITYVCDFFYEEDGFWIIEDVKGIKTDVYNLKKKMTLFHHPDAVLREVKLIKNEWIEENF